MEGKDCDANWAEQYREALDNSSRNTLVGLYREAIDQTGAALSSIFLRFDVPAKFQLAHFCEITPLSDSSPKRLSKEDEQIAAANLVSARQQLQAGNLAQASLLIREWNEKNVLVPGMNEVAALILLENGLLDVAFVQIAREIFYNPKSKTAPTVARQIVERMRSAATPLHKIMSSEVGLSLALIRAHALLHDTYFEYASVLAQAICHYSPASEQARKIVEGLAHWQPHNIVTPQEYLAACPREIDVLHQESRTHGADSKTFSIFALHNAQIVGKRPMVLNQRGQLLSDNGGLGSIAALIDEDQNAKDQLELEDCMPLLSVNSHAFWHWMMEQLPRLIFSRKINFQGMYLVPTGSAYVRESLQLLGIPLARVLFYDGCSRISAERLVLVDTPSKPDFFLMSDIYLTLRREILSRITPSAKRRRIYVKRSQTRYVINRDELLDYVEPYGFEVFDFDELSLTQQIELAASAEIFMAPHGAAFAHCLFLPEGAHVVEFFSPNYVNTALAPIHSIVGNYYHMITASNQNRYYPYRDQIIAPLPVTALVLQNIVKSMRRQNAPQNQSRSSFD